METISEVIQCGIDEKLEMEKEETCDFFFGTMASKQL